MFDFFYNVIGYYYSGPAVYRLRKELPLEKEILRNVQHNKYTNCSCYRDFGALAHLLKSSLGTGILAMPNAVKNGGALFGGIGTIIIGIICAHCVHILVRSSHVLCKKTKTPQMTYAETAEAAFFNGPKTLRPFANASRILVNIALSATYLGGTCVYVVFVSTSVKQVSLTRWFPTVIIIAVCYIVQSWKKTMAVEKYKTSFLVLTCHS